MSKTIGILGGMGSYATVEFFKCILDQFKVEKEWHYPNIMVYNNPKIPSRTRAVLYNEESPEKGMIEGCKKLEDAGVDFIVIPCNSAHAWYDCVAENVNVPIINMIEVVRDYIMGISPDSRKIGVIAGEVVAVKRLYHKAFEKIEHSSDKIEIVLADDECQVIVRKVIDDVKHNNISSETRSNVSKVIKYFLEQKVEGLVLGCTELPLIMENEDLPIPIYDSSMILAKKVAEMAK